MKITLTSKPKAKPDFSKLGFGKYFTDHMLLMEYHDGAWGEPQIIPYDDFKMNPATNILHYGQGIFEGVKAYKNEEGKITTFRIDENIKRMNRSAERLCMPTLDADVVLPAIFELIKIEKDWIPTASGTSLYIRPTMIADDPMLGVHAAHNYKFFVILSPVGSYYANGMQPTKIMVEEHYVRAPLGGTGEAKCMGNYAASLLASEIANKKGYDQVLWLDAIEHKLLKSEGYKVTERRISLDEVAKAYDEGRLNEAFGTGTAAVVSPVGIIHYNGRDMIINNQEMGAITGYLYEKLTGIQYGKREDKFGWITKIN